eukprot:1162589-Alexandrium_andersonii.AAC.1
MGEAEIGVNEADLEVGRHAELPRRGHPGLRDWRDVHDARLHGPQQGVEVGLRRLFRLVWPGGAEWS